MVAMPPIHFIPPKFDCFDFLVYADRADSRTAETCR
nr:MAG TPA: hypothetical protein [Bacteriophage sp.]